MYFLVLPSKFEAGKGIGKMTLWLGDTKFRAEPVIQPDTATY